MGGMAEYNLLFVEAILNRYKTGCPWGDLPERIGYWKNQRFNVLLQAVDAGGADVPNSKMSFRHTLDL